MTPYEGGGPVPAGAVYSEPTKIEQVARAIDSAANLGAPSDRPMSVLQAYGYIGMARAAIAAMREPTEMMIKSAMATGGLADRPVSSDAVKVWQAMIDAVLDGK